MFRFNCTGRISVSRWAIIYLAFLLLTVPIRFLFALVISAVIHEVFHLLVIKICCVKVNGISVKITGATIQTTAMEYFQEFLCALAGPAGSLLVAFLVRSFPVLAICCFFHGIINLLPLGSLDGARILRSALNMIVSQKNASRIQTCVEWLVLLCFGTVSIYLFLIKQLTGAWILIPVILILRKTPCKLSAKRVQ